MTRRRGERVQHEQSKLQLHALNAESHVSEHQQAAASLRDKLSRVNQQNERYQGFCDELQSTQSYTSLHTSRFKTKCNSVTSGDTSDEVWKFSKNKLLLNNHWKIRWLFEMVAEIHLAELNCRQKLVEQSKDIMNKWSVANCATRVSKE